MQIKTANRLYSPRAQILYITVNCKNNIDICGSKTDRDDMLGDDQFKSFHIFSYQEMSYFAGLINKNSMAL